MPLNILQALFKFLDEIPTRCTIVASYFGPYNLLVNVFIRFKVIVSVLLPGNFPLLPLYQYHAHNHDVTAILRPLWIFTKQNGTCNGLKWNAFYERNKILFISRPLMFVWCLFAAVCIRSNIFFKCVCTIWSNWHSG